MASFLDEESDTIQVFGKKRGIDAVLSKRHEQYFGRTRHNLLEDFDETPTKVIKHSKVQEILQQSVSPDSLKTPGLIFSEYSFKLCA